MATALSKVSEVFKTFNAVIGKEFKHFELHGRDARSSRWNDEGFTKQITSDFIRIYKPKNSKKEMSFSFAFNNYETPKTGVIVTFHKGKNTLRANYADFDLFRTNFKAFLKGVSSVEVLNEDVVEFFLTTHFTFTEEESDLEDFFKSLVEELQPLEKRHAQYKKQVEVHRPKIKKKQMALSEEDLKIREKLAIATSQASAVEKEYRDIIRSKVAALKDEKPYLSSRLIGRLLHADVKTHIAGPALSYILSEELSCNGVYSYIEEKLND